MNKPVGGKTPKKIPSKPTVKPNPAKGAATKKPTPASKPTASRRGRYKYDVCFSFAGEDREYVHRVAKCLKNRNVLVFYDNDEKAILWGKDLPEHFDSLYQNQARYCVMFISQHYKVKLWTRLERRSAMARAFKSRREYILPAYFDDTTVPGVRKTLAHIDLRTHKPLQLALLIIAKLRNDLPDDVRFSLPIASNTSKRK
jgi:hypothetical protein